MMAEYMDASEVAHFLHRSIFLDRWVLHELYHLIQPNDSFDNFLHMVCAMVPEGTLLFYRIIPFIPQQSSTRSLIKYIKATGLYC
jgi:hypothetical protein